MQEENQVVESAETTTDLEDNNTEDESTGESEVAETTESGEQQSAETPEQRAGRLKRQAEREAKKQGKTLEEYLGIKSAKGSQKSNKEESSEEEVDERYARLELKTEGVTSKKAQDIVLEYAKFKGIEPVDALKSPIVKAEIAELEKKTSAPAPSNRTGSGASNTFEYWVAQAKKGNFPRGDKEMMKKLQKARIFTK